MAGRGSVAATRLRSGLWGALVLVGVLIALFIALNAKSGLPFQNNTTVKVAFDNLAGLRQGYTVRVDQVFLAGRVSKIELRDQQAIATLQLQPGNVDQIYRNANAEIVSRSGLGLKYVNFDPGHPPAKPLPKGAVIPSSQTRDSDQLLELLQVLDEPTRDATESALRELGGGAVGHAQDLRDFVDAAPTLLPNLGTVSEALATNDGADLTSMLQSLDSLSARFENRTQQITQLNRQVATTLDAFAVDDGKDLRETLEVAPGAVRDVRTALTDLQQPLETTTSAVTKLQPGAKDLARATPDLRGVFREGQEPLSKVPPVSELAKPTVEDLTTVMHDAQPFAPKYREAMGHARDPLNVFAPYSPEIAQWFSNATSALSDGDKAGHWLRFTLIPSSGALSGSLPIQDPTTNSDAYPAPGQAPKQTEPYPDNLPLLGNLFGGGNR